jgi:polyketide synthase PksL
MSDAKTIFRALQDRSLSRDEAMRRLRALGQPSPENQAARTAASAAPPSQLGSASALDVAIIGMSGRYPGARDLATYWDNLAAGRNSVRQIPAARWDVRDYFDPRPGEPGKIYCNWLGALDEMDCFDPLFFHISPAEAEYMDPQQRLFLQEAYRAFEDAGYGGSAVAGSSCGVYLGIMSNEYAMMLAKRQAPIINATGNSFSIAAARISYLLDLKGPSIAVDTACSSSLVATHLACQALCNGEIDLALAGGVSLYLAPESYVAMCGARMLSPDGQCKAFDDQANGFVPGEGVGALVLKRYRDAVRDGDHVHARIVATGINQDGRTNGITAPNGASQASLIRTTYARYGIEPASISYCELHGTGTKLGDPVELGALAEVYRSAGVSRGSCAVGSVKSNIGHTSAAAGVAGVHKVALSLQAGLLAPSLHFHRPNQHFDFADSPFFVNTELRPWQGSRRRAAISSFGLSGTNAHVVLEAPPAQSRAPLPQRAEVIVLSARGEDQLREQAANLATHLDARPELTLADVAHTLQVGREAMPHRLAVRADSPATLATALRRIANEGRPDITASLAALDDEARAWVAGATVDWKARWQKAGGARRCPLPTYPFARQRYWLPEPAAAAPVRSLRYVVKTWQPAPLAATEAPAETGATIVLCTPGTRALAASLAARIAEARVVTLDEGGVSASLRPLATLVDVSGCDTEPPAVLPWLGVLQQIVQIPGTRLLGVTRGREAFENPEVNLAAAHQAAFYRLVRGEYPRLRARHVDLGGEIEGEALVAQILAEYRSADDEASVCLRGGRRYRAELEALPALPTHPSDQPLDPDKVVWITGGLRGLGLLCAKHLVSRHGVRKLLLSTRAALPPREQWAALRTSDHQLGQKIDAIAALEALGASVQVSSTSLTDRDGLASELDRVTSAQGAIGGIIHCAGLVDWREPAFFARPPSAMQAVLAPKTAGLDAMASALPRGGADLRFFLLFSSVAAVAPALAAGQLDYALANAYLDAFAEAHARRWPLTSLQWPSWRESGIGEVRSAAYAGTGLLSISDREGLAVLDSIIARSSAGVLLPAIVDDPSWSPKRRLVPTGPPPQTAATRIRPAATVPPRAEGGRAVSQVHAWLTRVFATELKIPADQLRLDTPFTDYGVDSIMLTQLLRPLNHHAANPLDPSLLFEHSTLGALADWLIAHEPDLLARAMGEGTAADVPVEAPAARVSAGPSQSERRAPQTSPIDVAVVGLACRFPGAPSLEDYWRLLRSGTRSIGKVPASRWGAEVPDRAGLLDNVTQFDPGFFRIKDREARDMDPQALLTLEAGLDLFYHAGYTLDEVRGQRIGAFLGGRSQHAPAPPRHAGGSDPVANVGQNYLAANLSQFFDLRGPALVVDTACSSALVAMYLAATALRAGDIDAAVVGGITLLHSEAGHRTFERRQLLAPDGQFHIFDRRAAGIVPGEGVGLTLLKPLTRAVADGDRIYAVIKGLAVNNDGRTAGPAAPSLQAQKDVLRAALAQSGKRADDVQYIEVNGSGSVVTDLLELKAITSVYGTAATPCGLGSMKPNIGHPLCAEGIAAFIKLVLMLHHRHQVPFLSGEQRLAHEPLERSRFHFPRVSSQWPSPVPVGAINCFADGGTNAHLIAEAYAGAHAPRRGPLAPPALSRRPLTLGVDTPGPAPVRPAVANVWRRKGASPNPPVANPSSPVPS